MLPRKFDASDINFVSRCYRLSRCSRRRSSCSIKVRSCWVINSRCRWCSSRSSSRCFAARSRSSTARRAASTSRTRVATFYLAYWTAFSLLSRRRAASYASRPNSFPMLSSSFKVCSIAPVARSTTRTASSALGIYRTILSTSSATSFSRALAVSASFRASSACWEALYKTRRAYSNARCNWRTLSSAVAASLDKVEARRSSLSDSRAQSWRFLRASFSRYLTSAMSFSRSFFSRSIRSFYLRDSYMSWAKSRMRSVRSRRSSYAVRTSSCAWWTSSSPFYNACWACSSITYALATPSCSVWMLFRSCSYSHSALQRKYRQSVMIG